MAQNNVTLHRPDGNETRGLVDVSNDPAGFDGLDFDIPRPQQQQQQPQFYAPPPPPQQQRPPPPPQQLPPQPEELNDFANPNKIEDSPAAGESPEMMMDDFNEYGDEYYDDQQAPQQHQQAPPQIQPLPPFETLEEERADLMYKLQRASRSGIQVRSFGWNADIREMRAEVGRAKAEQEVDASIAFQRQILMTICTGMEFANKRFAYLDLELDGWSENMMDDIGKFDTVFEKLHKKHAGRMNIPPELQLVFMIGGSALTWHLVSKSRKSRTIDEEMSKKRSKKKRKKSRQYDSDSDESERSRLRKKYAKPAKTSGKEMRGPGFDVGGMMGGMGGIGGLTGMLPQVPVPNLNPQMFSRQPTLRRVTSPESDAPSPAPSDVPSDAPSPAPSDAPSERLSDIPSELDDVPSTFGDDDFGLSLAEEPGTEKVFAIAEEKPKKKGPGRPKKDASKKIVII